MPKMLAGIRRIADLEPMPAMALPVPSHVNNATAVAAVARDTVEHVEALQVISDEPALVADVIDIKDSTPTDAGLVRVQAPLPDPMPLFAERTQPRVVVDSAPIAPEPFFTHQRAHDEMLRRALPAPSPAIMPAMVVAAARTMAAVSTHHAMALYEPDAGLHVNAVGGAALSHPADAISYEDEFLAALADQERARQDIQAQMQDQFVLHQQAHEEMLSRVAALAPAAVSSAADAVEPEDIGNVDGALPVLRLAPPAQLNLAAPNRYVAGPQPALTVVPVAEQLRAGSTEIPRASRLSIASGPREAPRLPEAGHFAQGVDWQPSHATRRASRPRQPRQPRQATAAPRRLAQHVMRTAATLIFATGAYFAMDGLTNARVDGLRMAVAGLFGKQSHPVALSPSPSEPVATLSIMATPAPAVVASGDVVPALAGVERLATPRASEMLTKARPDQPMVPLVNPLPAPVDRAPIVTATTPAAVAPPTTAAKAPEQPNAAPVPIEVRVGNLTAAQSQTIAGLVHPPVLIRKRQQIAAAVRPPDSDVDGAASRAPGRSLAVAVEHGAAAMAAIIPPRPTLVRESLVRTAHAALPGPQMSDVAIASSADLPRQARAGVNSKTAARPRAARVAALDRARSQPVLSDAGRRIIDTHATIGRDVRTLATAPPAQPSAQAASSAAWRRGEDLYARATLGRGQHLPDRTFAGEGPHAAADVEQLDAYVNILGFRIRRVQPKWAAPLFNHRQ